MKRLIFSSMIAGALALAAPVVTPVTVVAAQKAPKGATAQCKDGTYSSAKSKQGACSSHGGVGTWLADEKETKAASKDASRPSAEPVEKPSKSAKAPSKSGDPTAQCNDGTYSYAVHHQGACSGHQGVKTWFK
jgi:hypothetical protein